MKKATLADIAARTNVSISTVSLVLAGKGEGRCSPDLIETIQGVARDLGYRGNRLASALRSQKSRTIGFLSIGVATRPYAGQLILAAQLAAKRRGYDLLFVEVENEASSIQVAIDEMAEHLAAGIVIAAYFHHEIDAPDYLPKATVMANCFTTRHSVDTFIPAERESISQVLDEIGLRGHKNVAFIVHRTDYPAGTLRTKGFLAAAKKYGWQNADQRISLTSDSTADEGYEATRKLLLNDSSITAVVAFNDQLAMGVYQAVKELGLQVPEDVSVAGFDDLQLISEGLRPGLTTVRLPHFEMGEMAVEKLIDLCEGDDELSKATHEILGELVTRESIAQVYERATSVTALSAGSIN
ncbi:MAG: hypothetical protein RL319_694 [Actinomycetota bacterium]|jgi:LacI family transcriptional regulator